MKIVPEKATVFSDRNKDELTVFMDGFRISLSTAEARELSGALRQGLDQLGHSAPQDATAGESRIPDAAQRRVAEEPVQERTGGDSLRLFARILEATHAGVILTDPQRADHPITFANSAAAEMTGYTGSELIGQSWRMLFGSGSDAAAIERLAEVYERGHPASATLLHYRKDGNAFWAKLDLSPIRGTDGTIAGYIGVFLDVSEQKHAAEEAERARQAAERATQAKSEFIAGISHDLRTALTGLIGFTHLLLTENLSPEQRRYATLAREAGSALLAVINNVLDLSKIEAGKVEVAETDFSVIELAVSCHAAVWQAAREKGLDLNFVLKPDVVNLVRGDPDRIRRVLLNLLNNAIKFTERGNIVLSLSKMDDRPEGSLLKFAVIDTGIGIPREKQDLLFRRFSQIEGGAQARGGSGLGLSICKSLVEEMGGEIGVTSTPGVGSQFWFTVPLKPASSTLPRTAASPEPRPRAHILVAEDTPLNQELMMTLLRRAGHEVDLVTDGAAAVEAAARKRFDLILMDVQLPRMDGFAATRAIRDLGGEAGKVPILALTARALTRDIDECLAAGMNGHLSKPIDAALLLATVDRWTQSPPLREGNASSNGSLPPFSVHDSGQLRDLERHLGHDKIVGMLAAAADDIPQRIERMGQRLDDADFGRFQAHELVSIAGNLGFAELAAQSRHFIEACSNGAEDHIRTAFAELSAAADRALRTMRDLQPGAVTTH